jgi:pimeloyl-ACP methyl ester carboxylesterase
MTEPRHTFRPFVSRAKRGLASVLVGVGLLAIVGSVKQRRFEAHCTARNWPGAMVRTPGEPVHVWCEGTGDPVVLLEASGLGSSMQYRHILPAVAQRTTACAWDRPGMGLSPPTPGAASAPDQGERILAALSESGRHGQLVVVGASAGGLVSLYLARRHPERVVGIVLVDGLVPDAVDKFAKPLAKLATSARRAAWAARFGLLATIDPLKLSAEDACLTYRYEVLAATSDFLSALSESARSVRRSPPLPERMPLIVLRHSRAGDLVGSAASYAEQVDAEPTWVRLQEDLAAQSRVAQLRVVEGSGHLITNERPDAVIAAVGDVLDMVARPATTSRQDRNE